MFKLGEEVEVTHIGEEGVILAIQYNPNKPPTYTVKFKRKGLIPSSMDYDEGSLKLIPNSLASTNQAISSSFGYWGDGSTTEYWGSRVKHSTDTHCPICKQEWHITESPVLGDIWKTCTKCNRTYEDILDEK